MAQIPDQPKATQPPAKPARPASDWITAADALKREAQRTQGLALAGEIMTDIASLEQSAQEAKDRADAANAKTAAITAEMAGLEKDLVVRKSEIEAELVGSRARLAAGVESAKAAAEEQSSKLIEAAKAEAAAIERDSKQQKFIADRDLQEALTQAEKLRAEVKALTVQSNELSAQLAEFRDKLDAMKEEARRRFGG